MLQLLAIILEAAIVVVALLAARSKKKKYMYGFALTFLIYIFFDSARQFHIALFDNFLNILFFIASVSALWSVYQIYKQK